MSEPNQEAMAGEYERLYAAGEFRFGWEGQIWRDYKKPKYLDVITGALFPGKAAGAGAPRPTILEIGAGEAEISAALLERCGDRIASYTVTELTREGAAAAARRLAGFRTNGRPVTVRQLDATALDFPDASFDIVCTFDVMHHMTEAVARGAAAQMARVARRQVFLIEASALCLPRRLLELTARYRSTGEGSFYPWEYSRFFLENKGFVRRRLWPFLFMVPRVSPALIGLNRWVSELMERLPLVRWQCSSVALDLRKP